MDAVPGDQAAFYRRHEVASLLLRLLNRVRRHERASTDRGVIEFAGLEAVRSHGIDVAPGNQTIPVEYGFRRIRGCYVDVSVRDRFFGRERGLHSQSDKRGQFHCSFLTMSHGPT